MSLADGSISGPQLVVEDRDIDRMISLGANRHLVGIQYSGLLPQYNILIEEANAVIDGIQNHFPTSTITPLSATTDYNQMVFRVSGNQGAASYYIFDRSKNAITNIAAGYPNVSQAQIGRISAVRYSANDGLKIPAILTWPVGVENPKNLPLLVFPHGGPEAYDRMSFDWWAQYFARQGYLVFQPNFRGSAGFGTKFMHAGRGEWGRRMQQDVTDGVNELIRAGHADADRVCIMGASYGGYSALAGGAFTPDLYRCVVSFGGVSDLPKMLSDEAFYNGSTHWVVSYWNRVIGDSKKERQKLKDISPINFAAQFSAPVLLMHGRDDTVVHPRQSRRMHKALKRAKKTVEYVEFKGEDHWLSDSATRVAMLQEISKFLAVHNPPRLQSSSQVHIAPDPLN